MKDPLRVVETAEESATARLGARLAPGLSAGDVVALRGGLGSGKTVLARALIRARMGDPALVVPSPSFNLVQIYEPPAGPPIWHVDLYRLERASELDELGLEDAFLDAVTLIEWAEKAAPLLPADALHVLIETAGAGRRRLLFYGGPAWRTRLDALEGLGTE